MYSTLWDDTECKDDQFTQSVTYFMKSFSKHFWVVCMEFAFETM